MESRRSNETYPGREEQHWRICLECGNRFRVRRFGSASKWCSAGCQTSSYRAGRHQILESLAIGSRWW